MRWHEDVPLLLRALLAELLRAVQDVAGATALCYTSSSSLDTLSVRG